MMLKDALKAEQEGPHKEKSSFEEILASLGSKIFGVSSDRSVSLLNDIANRGRESFNELAEGMPVYRESDETGRISTYLAVNENFELRINKNKNKPETDDSNGLN